MSTDTILATACTHEMRETVDAEAGRKDVMMGNLLRAIVHRTITRNDWPAHG